MTATEMADQLIKQFQDENYFETETMIRYAKSTSIEIVEIILTELRQLLHDMGNEGECIGKKIVFWNQVKNELSK